MAFALILALLLALMGCGVGPLPALVVTGDCEGYSLTAGMPLEEAIALAQPRAEAFDVLLIGGDGMIARISGEELDGCALVYSNENAWELKSELHPPSARVKNLALVVVVNISEDPEDPYKVWMSDGNFRWGFYASAFYLDDLPRWIVEEGTSQLNGRSVTVYTTHYRSPLPAQFFREGIQQLCAMDFDGYTVFFRGRDAQYLEGAGNRTRLSIDFHEPIENLAGIMADPPETMITKTFSDALRFLEQGERVMIIELDGLGWETFKYAQAPYLESLEPKQALACFPPISQVGLASMLTGVTPDIHGIHSRDDREMASEDLFSIAAKMGKASAYIEGSHALLNTSIRPVLSLNDEEVLANAQKALESGPDLIFVHFHGIDEAAHEHGPRAARSMLIINEIDGYVQALAEGFDGRVIITADHGLHATENGGDHGLFIPEDMIVPYIVR